MESFESLWEYCTSNNRVIPKVNEWDELFNMLKNKKRKPSGGWEPALPQILAAWHVTMPIEKHLRFKEHIHWAGDNGQIEEIGAYLRALNENDWYHFGEI